MSDARAVLRDVANQPLNTHAARKAAQEWAASAMPPSSSAGDALAAAREHFSKLKFNFLELETKLRFLTQLEGLRTREDLLQAPAGADEDVARTARSATKAIKNSNEAARAGVAALAAAVAAAEADLAGRGGTLAATLDRIAALEAQAAALGASIDAQREQAAPERAALAALDAEAAALEADADALARTEAALAAEVAALDADAQQSD